MKKVGQAFSLSVEDGYVVNKVIVMAMATVQDAIMVSMLTDDDMSSSDRKSRVEAALRKLDALEKKYPSLKSAVFPPVVARAARMIG